MPDAIMLRRPGRRRVGIAQVALGEPRAAGLAFLHVGAEPAAAWGATYATLVGAGNNYPPAARLSPQGLPSLDFKGAQYARWSTCPVGNSPAEVTLLAVVTPDALPASGVQVNAFGVGNSSATTQLFRLLANGVSGGANWMFQVRGDNSTFANITDSANITVGRTYVLAAVFRSGTGEKALYVDGKKVASSTTDIGAISLTQTELGARIANSPGHYFTGALPFAAIYRRALTDSEIASVSEQPAVLARDALPYINASAIQAPVVPTGNSVSPGAAALVLTGHAPTVTQNTPYAGTPGVAALSIVGPAPAVTQNTPGVIQPGAATLPPGGPAPVVTQAVPLGSLTTEPLGVGSSRELLAGVAGWTLVVKAAGTDTTVLTLSGLTTTGDATLTTGQRGELVRGTRYDYEALHAVYGRILPSALAA